MKTKLYWGLGILIGISAFLLTRPTDTEPKDVYIDVDPISIPPLEQTPSTQTPAESTQNSAEKPTNKIGEETTETNTDKPTDIPSIKTEGAYIKIEGAEEPKISPHGFGPYPRVPKDYFETCGPTSWQMIDLYGLAPPS